MRSGLWMAASLLGMALGGMATSACGGHDCGPGTSPVDGACVADTTCGPGTVQDQGACVPAAEACGSSTVLIDGQCRDPATVTPDVTEPAEPNGLDPGHTAGSFVLPGNGASTTLGGCIDPGATATPDYDLFRFEAAAPTLLEIAVDGYGGLLGGFVMMAENSALPALVDNDWRRVGVAVSADRASRQVFVPAAGSYGLAIADSRTLLDPTLAAGNGDTCYLATITTLAVPAPEAITTTASGVRNGEVAFHRYSPGEGDLIFATAAAPDQAVLVDLVAMVNGEYRASSPASRPRGASAEAIVGGLEATDEVLLVIDPVIDLANPGDMPGYTIDVFSPAPVALPENGSTVTVPGFGVQDSDPVPSFAYFDAAAGDVMFLDLWTDAAQGVLVTVFTRDLELVTVPCGPACTSYQGHIQLAQAGRYYLALVDVAATQPGSFSLGARREHIRPETMPLGTQKSDQALDSRGDRFYQLDIDSFAWLALSGAALSGFAGDLEVTFYDRDDAGELDDEVPVRDAVTLPSGASPGRIVDHSASWLVRVRDSEFAGAPGRFDLLARERPYDNLGSVDESTAIERLNTALATGDRHYYLARATPGSIVDVRVTGKSGLDPVFTEYDRVETPLVTDASGVDAVEVPLVVVNESADWVAFAITGAGAGGAYDLTVGAREPPVYQAATGAAVYTSVCPDDGGAGQVHALRGDGNPWGWPANDEGVSMTPLDVSSVGFRFYGIVVQELTISSNGWLTFTPGYAGSAEPDNQRMPGAMAPDALVAPLWSDYQDVIVCTEVTINRVVVQWQGKHVTTGAGVAMQAVLVLDASDHRIEVIYAPDHAHDSNQATIGVEDRLGVRATQASYDTAGNAAPGTSWSFTITP